MQAKSTKDKWARCPLCGHKLFKIVDTNQDKKVRLEVKCHSCKGVSEIKI